MSLLDLCMDAVGVAVLRVAVYCRVSTDEQAQGTSLDDQEFAGRGWVVAQGERARCHGVYRDDFTGTTDERPEWLRLLGDVRAGLVDVIVFTRWDRWARDEYVGQKMRRDVAPYGVRLVCLTLDVDESTPEGDLMIGQMLGFAAFDKRNIVRRCSLGQHGTAAQGFWPGGTPRYGYRVEGRKRQHVCVPDFRDDGRGEADTMRRAWHLLVAERASYPQACAALNAEGRYRRGGLAWEPTTLRQQLTAPTITGRFTWGGTKKATGKWGEAKTLTFAPILTDDEYAALLAASGRKPVEQSARRFYLLGGRFVAACGDRYHGAYRKDRDLRQYKCHGKEWKPGNPESCDCARLEAPDVEGRVWAAVSDFLGDADRMNRLAADYLGLRDMTATAERDELADVRRHAATLERAITTTLVEYARQGIDPTATAAATKALQDELTATREREAAILAWQADSAAEAQRVRDIASIAEAARDRLGAMTEQERADVLRLLDVTVTALDPTKTPALRVEGRLAWLDLHSTLAGNVGECPLSATPPPCDAP